MVTKDVLAPAEGPREELVGVYMSLVLRKPVFRVSDQVPHKPGCTTTQDG